MFFWKQPRKLKRKLLWRQCFCLCWAKTTADSTRWRFLSLPAMVNKQYCGRVKTWSPEKGWKSGGSHTAVQFLLSFSLPGRLAVLTPRAPWRSQHTNQCAKAFPAHWKAPSYHRLHAWHCLLCWLALGFFKELLNSTLSFLYLLNFLCSIIYYFLIEGWHFKYFFGG